MKSEKFTWPRILELKTPEERMKVWEEIHHQHMFDRFRKENENTSPLLFLPYFIFATIYTLYLSCFVPFFGLENLSEISYKLNLGFMEPAVSWIKKLFDAVGLGEPASTIIGFVIFVAVIPAAITFALNTLLEKHNSDTSFTELPDIGKTEKEQLVKILDSREGLEKIRLKYPRKLLSVLIFVTVGINTFIFYSGRMCDGALKNVYGGDSVSAPLLITLGFIIANLAVAFFFRAVFSDKGQSVPLRLLSSIDCAELRIKEIEEAEAWMAREAEWNYKFSKAVSLLQSGKYQEAENAFFRIRKVYIDDTLLLDYYYGYAAKNEDEYIEELESYVKQCAESDKDIEHVVKYIADAETGFAIARFSKRNNLSLVSVAKVMGVIDRNSYLAANEEILQAARKIVSKYSASFTEKAESEYVKGVEFFEDDDMENAKKHLRLPALMNYKDAEPLYAVASQPVEDQKALYREALRTITNTKKKIICESHRHIADKTMAFLKEKTAPAKPKSTSSSSSSGYYTGSVVDKVASTISDDDAAFMDWTIKQNKLDRYYEKLRAEGLSNYHPLGDTDFPLDAETFPDSSQIW